MLIIYTTELILISVLFALNISNIVRLLNQELSQNCIILSVFLISATVFAPVKLYCEPVMRLIVTTAYYILLFFYLCYRNNTKKMTIYIALFYLMLDSIWRSASYLLINAIFHIDNKELIVWSSSLTFNVGLFLVLNLNRKKFGITVTSGLRTISNKIYILILIAFIFAGGLLENQISTTSNIEVQAKITKFFTVITLAILIFIIIALIVSCITKSYFESASNLLEKQVKEQVKYYQKIDHLNKEIRRFRHDYKNHMICLQSLIEKNDRDEALEYIKGITHQDIIESFSFFSGNQIADAILYDKTELAKQSGGDIKFDGFISDKIPASDLCIILSNALDNAIEACARLDSDDNKVIKIKCACIKGIQIIKILNPNSNMLPESKTSKDDKENHGYGLYNIKRTIEKFNGQMKISSQTPLFVLELEFKVR